MRKFSLLLVAGLALSSTAIAQDAATIPITTPAPAASSFPMTPVQAPAATAPAATGNASDQLMNQLQNALHSKNQGQALQQGIAVAGLMGCTSKTAGKPATDAFYQKLQATGKQIEALCKAKQPDQARQLTLTTIKANQANPVVLALNNCYATNKANFDMMAGPELSHDAENYARWLKDPALAQREMRNEDICK